MFACKLLFQALFGILVIFTVQGYGAPISFRAHEESLELSSSNHISSMNSPLLSWHGTREYSRPETPIGVVKFLNSHKEEQENESSSLSSNPHTEHRSFIKTHLALVIIMSILALFVLCLAFYPIFRHYRNRHKESQAAKEAAAIENADQSFDEKDPDTSSSEDSEDSDQSHLEALPARLVYVPPTPENGTHPLFGHFLSPCGQVLGVKDTWKLATPGDGKNILQDNILFHEA